jgi:anti-sigma28 factor (negative regulator of flagellin synthesis)
MDLSSAAQGQRAVIGSIHLAVTNRTARTSGGVHAASVAAVGNAPNSRSAKELAARVATVSDVRFELVSALRARILAGTYRVGAADLAESLMGSMRR